MVVKYVKSILISFLLLVPSTSVYIFRGQVEPVSPRETDAISGARETVAASSDTLASITKVGNYQDIKSVFSLESDSRVSIVAVGEGRNCDTIIPSGNCDNIELYFDMLNEKVNGYDDNDRQLRFAWNETYIKGINARSKGIIFRQSDLSKNKYQIEMKIPWKTLGDFDLALNSMIGFDITISDRDNSNLSKIGWYSKTDGLWEMPSLFGNLQLGKLKTPNSADGLFIATYTEDPPVIDGQYEKHWGYSLLHIPKNLIFGKIDNKADLEAIVRCLWDKDNIYFLVTITDDVKVKETACDILIWDYGWLEDVNGNLIWKMLPEKAKHAGGAPKNIKTDTTMQLKAGDYFLRYVTDESHAYGKWDDTPPDSSLYGIVIYKTPEN